MQLLYPCQKRLVLALLAILFASPPVLFASGKAFNTLVVVNTNSTNSIDLGNYYAKAHGIPNHHICSLGIATNLATLTSNEFQTLVRGPITNHIATENLIGQIDFVVLCQDLPTRVENTEGITAALFYGFKNAPSYWTAGCNLPANTSNTYFQTERSFRSDDGWNSTNGFIAFHIIASNLPTAKLVVDRGAAAQSSFPASAIYLYMIGEISRSGREQHYANTQFSFRSLPELPIPCVFGPQYSNLSSKTNVMGYQDGMANIPLIVRTNNLWISGAYADYLTSSGGRIPPSGQSTVLDWMEIGATASYGTVEEPCAYPEKFPDPLMGFYYARGFSIGESYAMGVEAPYQGLFAGDPLAAPFAAPPSLSVTSHTPYQIVTGTVPVQVSATAHSNGVPAAAIDFYLDERLQTNLITLGPTPSNRLSIVVGTRTNTATVATNDSLFDAVSALANAVNADTTQTVSATATGDRLELIYKQYNHDGDNLPVAASVAQGEAAALTLDVGQAATNLIPSIYPARKLIQIADNPWGGGGNTGDTLTCVITLTNGIVVSNTLISAQDESRRSILERLRTVISTNTLLLAANGIYYNRLANGSGNVLNEGTLFARTPGPDGAGIQVDYTITPTNPPSGFTTNNNFSSFLQDNPNDLRARASILFHITPTNGVLAAETSIDTTLLSDGIHTNDFIARDGSAVAAASRLSLPLVICNSSPQLSLLGTNGVAVTNDEPASLIKGTDFGPVDQGKALTNTYSLHNNGTTALAIAGWTTNGSGTEAFQIMGIPSAIQIGGVSNFTVVFTPTNNDSFQASLDIDSDAILPQTNLLFAGTGVVYRLTVASEHGTPTPAVGIHTNLGGAILTNSISVPAPDGGTQLVSAGWAMAGNAPLSGSATNFIMTVTNDASLTWLWATNYWLETTTSLHGSVNVDDDWQPGGVTTQITATADLYYHVTNWTGDASGNDNPLNLLMNAPKSIQANFTENFATNDTPEWWLAEHGWTNNFDAAATTDAEPDGFPTWQEYIGDTDPTNAVSYPQMSLIETYQTNYPILTWPASTGRIYHIQRCDDLEDGDWTNQILSLGSDTWTDTNPPPPTNRYYRISPHLP